jgi:hypothetical protein
MIASPSATVTSRATATTNLKRASGTTQGTPKSASQTKMSRVSSAICVARSRGTMKHSLRKPCTNNARCTRSDDIRSSSASASTSDTMLHPFLKPEIERTSWTTTRVTSQGLKISRSQRMLLTSFSGEMAASPPSARRS